MSRSSCVEIRAGEREKLLTILPVRARERLTRIRVTLGTPVLVPEPSSVMLLGAGLWVLGRLPKRTIFAR
jgi:hypothetical protein